MSSIIRCSWCESSNLMRNYHDKEWGTPQHKDKIIFEYILLDTFQAGLSWSTILNKRENFKKAFSNFDPVKISKYTEKDYERLMNDPGIIRNKLKIRAMINNAKIFLELQKEFGTFDKYIWQFVDYKTIGGKRKIGGHWPSTSKESDAMSKDLKDRGFKFVGSTICYAFMQAAGMVNDHIVSCTRYNEVQKIRK